MNEAERLAWKQHVRPAFDRHARAQIAAVERSMPHSLTETRAERLEEIREGIKARARAYRHILADPLDDERFELILELFDEIVDDLKRVSVS